MLQCAGKSFVWESSPLSFWHDLDRPSRRALNSITWCKFLKWFSFPRKQQQHERLKDVLNFTQSRFWRLVSIRCFHIPIFMNTVPSMGNARAMTLCVKRTKNMTSSTQMNQPKCGTQLYVTLWTAENSKEVALCQRLLVRLKFLSKDGKDSSDVAERQTIMNRFPVTTLAQRSLLRLDSAVKNDGQEPCEVARSTEYWPLSLANRIVYTYHITVWKQFLLYPKNHRHRRRSVKQKGNKRTRIPRHWSNATDNITQYTTESHWEQEAWYHCEYPNQQNPRPWKIGYELYRQNVVKEREKFTGYASENWFDAYLRLQ